MMYDKIRTPEDALAYFTDCQLATVCDLAMKKSRRKYDYERQMQIAQKMVNRCIDFKANIKTTRANEVVNDFNRDVAQWAKKYEPN